jgi:hypothetical protein
MSNSAFEKMNKTGTKSELKGEPSWDATIRNFKEKQSKLPKSESAKVGTLEQEAKKYKSAKVGETVL